MGFETGDYDNCAVPGRKTCQGQLAKTLPPTKCHSTPRVLKTTWLWCLSMVGLRARLESRPSGSAQPPQSLSQHTFPNPPPPHSVIEKQRVDLRGSRTFQGGLRT